MPRPRRREIVTPFQRHMAYWKNCRRCELCKARKNVVIARGRVPCDILFVGEAPGDSEDAIGRPFVGPAGHLLNKIIERAWRQTGDCTVNGDGEEILEPNQARYCLTNLVACTPGKDIEGKGEPPEKSIRECSPRLQDFISNVARPRLIVCVGKLAFQWCPRIAGVQYAQIVHPAAILRQMDVSQRGLAVQRAVVTLADALAEI